VQFLKDIAQGVLYLRERGVPFELVPANLLVDEKWTVKVADYGFEYIRIANQTITQSQAVSWTAPEVFAGQPEREKAVVYSYGIIMWQILTRKTPWEGKHAMKIMYLVEKAERPPVNSSHDIEGMSAGDLEKYTKLLQSIWSHNPDARPTFAEIVYQLDSLL